MKEVTRRRILTPRVLVPLVATVVLISATAAAFGGAKTSTAAAKKCNGTISGKQTLTAWFHSGTGTESDTLKKQIKAFNKSQKKVTVKLKLLPEGNYNDQVKAAAAVGKLPDILDFDGPFVYNYAWNGNIIPIDSCVSKSLKKDLLPSIIKQGMYNGHLYSMGLFEAGLGLYARKSVLKKASIRIPTGPSDAWTAAEFTSALKKLKADGFTKPLDAKMNYGQSEWYTYGFAPIIWSAGGDLINRKTYKTASGVLNSPADIAAMTVFKSWFDDDLVDPNKDDAAFLNGRSAISWVGHWQYTSYKAKFGSDLVILPLPNFGHGSKSASGSWNWGITSGVKDPDAAWSFLAFLLKTKQQVQTATGNGGVPSTASAYNKMSTFKAGGDERIYVTQLKSGVAMARPQTPAYPVITVAFRQAVADISAGGDVKTALDAAVKTINQDLRDNYYYPKLKK